MSLSFKEDLYQGVYPPLYLGFDSLPEQYSFTATPFSDSYQRDSACQRSAASAFVYLPNGQFTSGDTLKKLGLPSPKFQYVGHFKNAVLKEIVVQGKRFLYYEYPSKFGHQCRLEIVSTFDDSEPHLFDSYSRGSSKKARKAAEEALMEYVCQKLASSDVQPLDQKRVVPISATDSAPTTFVVETEPSLDPKPDYVHDESSEDQKRQEEILEDLKEGLGGAYEAYGEYQAGEEVEEDSSAESLGKKGRRYRAAEYVKKMAQKVDDAAHDVLLTGRREYAKGSEQLEQAGHADWVARQLDRKLQEGRQEIILTMADGSQKKISKAQAEKLLAEARLKTRVNVVKGMDNVFRGAAKASVGHSVQSGVKRLGKEIKQGRDTGLNALGSNLGAAAVDFIAQGNYSFEAAGGAAKEVVGSTVKGVGVQVVQNVGYSMVKGAAKELAPELVKKIPGVSALNATYSVGKAFFTAKTAEEAFANGFDAVVDTGISFGCASVGQFLLPIPFVGATVGSAAGSGVILLKNYAVVNLKNWFLS